MVLFLVFLPGLDKAFASPIDAVSGEAVSMSFLERCIMESHVPVALPADRPCPPPFICGPEGNRRHVEPSGGFLLAGMAVAPEYGLEGEDPTAGRIGDALSLLVVGAVLVGLSAFIRSGERRRLQRASLHENAGAVMVREHTVTVEP